MAQGEVPARVEDEVTSHLRQVELLRSPDPSPQDQPNVTPYDAGRGNRSQAPTGGTKPPVAPAGKPSVAPSLSGEA